MSTINSPILIALTGGIGSGKSVVAHILMALGYKVYDCDSRAKALMESADIKTALAGAFGTCIFDADGQLRRQALASIVFSDPASLKRLNNITHSAVRTDLAIWADSYPCEKVLFVETAILYQSGIDRMVDQVWEIKAPRNTRIERVVLRNNLPSADIIARIEAQDSYSPDTPHHSVSVITNDGLHALLPQIETLIAKIS